MQCTRTIILFCIIKELLLFVILKFCPEHNINSIRDSNLQRFLNKHLAGEHTLVFTILLLLSNVTADIKTFYLILLFILFVQSFVNVLAK